MRLKHNVDTWERAASIAIGVALIGWAARQSEEHNVARRSALSLAAGFLGRGASGYCPVNDAIGRNRTLDDTRKALSGGRGTSVSAAITIARPPEDVFALWRDPNNLSRFMRDVEQVTSIDQDRWHWIVRGPGGVRVQFDSELINVVEGERLGWRTLEGADVASAGSVQFQPRGKSSTEVIVHMQYAPPGGKAGSAVAWLTGHEPAKRLREDLRRLKAFLEAGEVPTTRGQSAGRRRPVNLSQWVDA